jgi:hypothetical protein
MGYALECEERSKGEKEIHTKMYVVGRERDLEKE